MILYYALGGGLGHLMRALKIRQALTLSQDFRLLSNCPQTAQLLKHDEFFSFPAEQDPKNIQNLLLQLVRQHPGCELWLDTFPCGVLGELNLQALADYVSLSYIARYVHWPNYVNKLQSLARFSQALIVDELHPQQRQFVKDYCEQQHDLDISECSALVKDSLVSKLQFPGAWLVMHSGPVAELDQLMEYAQEKAELEGVSPEWVVASQVQPSRSGLCWIKSIPHNIDLESIDRIFSACGYNTMMELRPYRHKHQILPMPRRYDDQFLRAERHRLPGKTTV